MASRGVKDAVNELGRFFGIRSADAFLKDILGPEDSGSPLEAAGKKADDIFIDLINSISGKSDAAPSVAAILTRIEEMTGASEEKVALETLNTSLSITVDNPEYSANLSADKMPLNAPKVMTAGSIPDETQGMFKPVKSPDYYTVADYAISETNKSYCPVHVMQVFPAVQNISNSDTDVAALFMNAIPTLEWARAVPILDIVVLVKGSTGDDNSTRSISLGRHLLGGDMSGEGDVTKMMFTAEDAGFDPSTDTTKPAEVDKEWQTAATMEIFTSPQTMVPVDAGGRMRMNSTLSDDGSPLDPFRPMLSLNSFSLNSVGTQGMHAIQAGQMSLVLHDRSQLANIVALVSPHEVGNVKLKITYGWSHPDGRQGRLADVNSNRFADLINAMRVTEIFSVTNTEFEFEESGGVNIDLNLMTTGGTSMQTVDITLSEVVSSYESLRKTTDSIGDMLTEAKTKRIKVGKLNVPTYLQRATNADAASVLSADEVKELKAWKKKAKDKDLRAIGGFITTMLNKKAKHSKSKAKAINNIIDNFKETPDPFLRKVGDYGSEGDHTAKKNGRWASFEDARTAEAGGKNRTAYVSLGKLLSYLVGRPLADTTAYDEIQMIFYAFNESASYLYDCNIAQFPIHVGDLREVLNKRFDNSGRMTIQQFLAMIDDLFLKDQGQRGYGFGKVYDQKNREDNLRQREFVVGLLKGKKGEKKPDLLKINNRKQEILRKAYGLQPDDPGVTLKPPQVMLRLEAVDMQEKYGMTTSGDKTLLKIHVFDQKCSSGESLKDVFEGFVGNGTCKTVMRPPVAPRSTFHSKVYAKQLEILEGIKVIEKITEFSPAVKATGMKEDDIKRLLSGMYVVKVDTPSRLKNVFSTLFPTFVYGSSNSAIISAKVATMNNPSLAAVKITGQSKAKSGDNHIDPGLPMFVTPTTLTMETFGFPYFAIGQQYFVDMMTNTTADNFYGVFGVSHSFESGKFTTSLTMSTMSSYGKWESIFDNLKELTTKVAVKAIEEG